MRVLVVGATGGSGRAAVEELLAHGHEVTAFARHPGRLDLRSPRLRKQIGDATYLPDVERAVEGQDAVVVTLGVTDNPLKVRLLRRSRTPIDVCSVGTRNVVQAMKRFGVRRLVVESALGVGDTRPKVPWYIRAAFRLLMEEQLADKELQESIVRESGLDWVIVQPVGLTNSPPSHNIYSSVTGEFRRRIISRRDVADFMRQALGSARFVGKAVALSG